DADYALEVVGELALGREAGAGGDLRQGRVASMQQQLGPFDAASDDVLVRRQPGGRLGLPGEVVALKRATAAICPRVGPVSRCPSMYSTTARSCPRGSVPSSPRAGWRGPRRAVFGGRPDDRRLVRPILRASVRRHRS